MPPQTALVEDALQLATETHRDALLFHSWRTYLFGSLIAAHERLDHDPALFFAAAILKRGSTPAKARTKKMRSLHESAVKISNRSRRISVKITS